MKHETLRGPRSLAVVCDLLPFFDGVASIAQMVDPDHEVLAAGHSPPIHGEQPSVDTQIRPPVDT
ncbi:MAG TPA: hypothetical protein DGD08_04350 [Gemmatimonas aurantiaca]|uniref:Uncharacterized protein n=1 Tax=Gemmatimonas aurantiaca TaxID=173480 RepID=A0A3D4V7X7_9BACT|nr:hypothetical protein [Gemmatimonas aurantiaca]